jgi:hypothetical protein
MAVRGENFNVNDLVWYVISPASIISIYSTADSIAKPAEFITRCCRPFFREKREGEILLSG